MLGEEKLSRLGGLREYNIYFTKIKQMVQIPLFLRVKIVYGKNRGPTGFETVVAKKKWAGFRQPTFPARVRTLILFRRREDYWLPKTR
jgi:hypothetical protein